MTRLVVLFNRWWPIPAFIAGSVIVQILTSPHPTPIGHAAGHYGNATVLFAIGPIVAITVWASAANVRRRPVFWFFNAALLAATAVVYAANMQIVNAIGGERWTNDQVELFGPTRPGFEAGHVLTQRAELASAVIMVVFAVCLGRWHALKPAVVAAIVVVSIIVPPWIFPGRGIVIIAIAFLHQRAKRLRTHSGETIESMPASHRVE